MFRRILVPADGSERGHQSVTLATRLAKRFGATVLLVRVKPLMASVQDIALDRCALDALAEEVRREGVACDTMLDLDRTVEGIVATAKYQNSDLIVMAPHHRSWIAAVRHPSVTGDMIAQAPAPLLIWPEHLSDEDAASFLESPAALVIVPLDGSELAEQALPYAISLAEHYGRALLLVRVVLPAILPSARPQTTQVHARIRGEELEAARAYMQHIRERIAAEAEVPVQSMILGGAPTPELLRLADAHPESVFVMTTHGRGRVGRAVLGSVAADLALRASVPMFVLRAGTMPDTTEHGSKDVVAVRS